MARHIDQYKMIFDDNFSVKSYDFSDQEKRMKSLEKKMDFVFKKSNIETPEIKKYSDWGEFLSNLGIQYDEDILFLLEQNFNLPTSKKNENFGNEKNAQYFLNKYGYENNTNDLPF